METRSYPINEQPAVDTRWYDRFIAIGSKSAYEYFADTKAARDSAKEKFLSDPTQNPTFEYPDINIEEILNREESLVKLKEEIANEEADETVKRAYTWKINEKIGECRLLRAAAEKNMKQFRLWTYFLYGGPSPELYTYTITDLHTQLTNDASSENTVLQDAAKKLQELLPKPPAPDSVSETLPTNDVQTQVTNITKAWITDTLPTSDRPDADMYTSENIAELFEAALQSFQADDWKVVIDDTTSATGIRVSQEKKQVRIPQGRQVLFNKLRTLIAHEIGTHVARREAGERSKLKLLGIGLDRYESAEEGIATLREQVLTGPVKRFSGEVGHLAISLAKGLDGTKRDFKDVYSILQSYYYWFHISKGKNENQALESSQKSAWNRCVRTFRGTNANTPGVCFTKDIIYREGNAQIWKLLGSDPSAALQFNIGKFDPTNERHVMILSQLGITDKEINEHT